MEIVIYTDNPLNDEQWEKFINQSRDAIIANELEEFGHLSYDHGEYHLFFNETPRKIIPAELTNVLKCIETISNIIKATFEIDALVEVK